MDESMSLVSFNLAPETDKTNFGNGRRPVSCRNKDFTLKGEVNKVDSILRISMLFVPVLIDFCIFSDILEF